MQYMNLMFDWRKQYFTTLYYTVANINNPQSVKLIISKLKISAKYIILKFKEYLSIILLFSVNIFIFSSKACCFFIKLPRRLIHGSCTNVAILKTQIYWWESIKWEISHSYTVCFLVSNYLQC